jgi:methionine-gamma-lyase
MTQRNTTQGLQTTAIHAGEAPDPATGASAPAIHMSSTFVVDEPAGFSAHDLGPDSPYLYARWANPTVDMLERKIAALEGVEACLCTASGMAAASAIFFTFLSAGDHLLVSDVSYAGVAELARDTLPRLGIDVTTVDMSDLAAVATALRPNTKLVHCETPVNPIGRLTDLAAVAKLAHDAGALLSCDATFAAPLGQNAAGLGVDLILHSATKYIGGHGDAVGGVVAGRADLIKQMRLEAGIHHGGVMSPFNAWLIARGAATLPLRMKAHAAGAQAVAEWLETRPSVTQVIYPGLPSHPQYALAQRQMTNTSGMIAFQVGDAATGAAKAHEMIEKLKVIHYAVSLGHHRSLIFWMETAGLMDSSFRLTKAQLDSYRAFAGDGIFRLSVGLEDADDLIADLAQVL